MTRSQSTIPFHNLTFHDDMPKQRDVEKRLNAFLKTIRESAQRAEIEAGRMTDEDRVYSYDIVTDADMRRIKMRSVKYVERLRASTGMDHLSEENQLRLGALKGGLPVAKIKTEHEADEIAATLHSEMPWMAPATEAVWHGLRASARNGVPGLRFNPLVLVGSPGIGKSHWARRVAHHLSVPTTMIEATGEPAMRERHGGPLVVIDEIEKSGEVHSNKGARHTLTDALLPLLERMTAATWQCPFFQVKFDMSWVNWVMTANSRQGLPEPLQSRCVVLDLPDLTTDQLRQFAQTEGTRRGLPSPAIAALMDVFESVAITNAGLSLRTVSRMLDRAETLVHQPLLN